jgi:putative transposase
MRLFHKDADFDAFERVLGEGLARYPVDLLTYCLMNNHWHLVLRPRTADSLGRLMGWNGKGDITHY